MNSPLTSYVRGPDKQLAYLTGDGHVHELTCDQNNQWTHADLCGAFGFPAAVPPNGLQSAVLRTHTNGDDKDHDTGIYVDVHDNGGNTIAYIGNAERSDDDSKHYNDGSDHSFDVPLSEGTVLKSDCTNFKWRMGIQASGPNWIIKLGGTPEDNPGGGNDQWQFDAWLTLNFGDGTFFTTDKLGQTLNSTGGELVWDDFN